MLHYDEYGSKENPAILLLHGAGALDTFCAFLINIILLYHT